jgi:uncharacterized membrane protein
MTERPAEATPLPVLQDPKQREILIQIAAQLNTFVGALPHPEILERYERLIPVSAERLLKMTEAQSAHRIQIERIVVTQDTARSKQGLIAGTIVTLGLEVISALLVLKGNGLAGAGLGGFAIAALAGVFVYGTRSRREEREEKARIMTDQLRLPLDEKPPAAQAGS